MSLISLSCGNIARLLSALGQYSRNFGKSASLLTSMPVTICILLLWLTHVCVCVEPPQSPHNVTVARVTSTSVTLNVTSSAPPANQRSPSASAANRRLGVTSSAPLANQLPITSWRVRYTMADQQADELTSELVADGQNHNAAPV